MTLPTNALVTGVSGVVITYEPGIIRLMADLPQDDLRSGDTILTYTYRGEGFSAVWFNGRFYHDYSMTSPLRSGRMEAAASGPTVRVRMLTSEKKSGGQK